MRDRPRFIRRFLQSILAHLGKLSSVEKTPHGHGRGQSEEETFSELDSEVSVSRPMICCM